MVIYAISVNPITVWIRLIGEEVVWKCNRGDVRVDFDKNGTPFSNPTYSAPVNTDAPTGEPVNTTKKKYGYTLTITPKPPISYGAAGVISPIVIDPDVVVWDGGPPGGGGGTSKKAAKKKGKKKRAKKKVTRRR